MEKIRIAVVGVGNCASALIQGIHHYEKQDHATGLMHPLIADYRPSDMAVAAAFDIDARKVGKDVSEAIFEKPNCARRFCDQPPLSGARVEMGIILDGFAAHLKAFPEEERFVLSTRAEPTREHVIQVLKAARTEIVMNYLPVGSEQATRFYAACALEAGAAFINCIPVFIASQPAWAEKFREKHLPLVGDDIKAQCGATITHRVLTDLFKKRGIHLERTYQLNTGGNTDFLNMLNADRIHSKKISKTEAVQSVWGSPLSAENIHIGPSDYVAWQKDNKICFIRMEGRGFGNLPIHLDLKLSVEDSPNSAGVAIDAIRCCKLALLRGEGGVLTGPSAYLMKRPPLQMNDNRAYQMMEDFIVGLDASNTAS